MGANDIVYVNVGGGVFTTLRRTLSRCPLLVEQDVLASDVDNFFIDRDPTHFRHILNWMRGVHFLPEDEATLQELAWEADFYKLSDLRDVLTRVKHRVSISQTLAAIHGEIRDIGRKHK